MTRSGIDVWSLSGEVRPQDDLHEYVTEGWQARTEIPADQARMDTFVELSLQAEENLQVIVAEAAGGDAEARQVADLLQSFLAEDTIEQLELRPLIEQLGLVDQVTDLSSLLQVLGRLRTEGVDGLFTCDVAIDAKNSERFLIHLGQSGLGLPDESYYRENGFETERTAYVAHVARMLELAELPAAADRIVALETRLAEQHWDVVAKRDATASYNKFDRAGLAELAGLDWAAWLAGAGIASEAFAEVIVRQPSYLSAVAKLLSEVPLGQWKEWLTWRVVKTAAPLLGAAFVEENFAFYGRTLTGATEPRARWKRGLDIVETAMGSALGRLYAERHFPPAAKLRMTELVDNLIEAYRQHITALDWMSPQTKERALDKLGRFVVKIGYPEVWTDYARLEIRPDDLAGNVRRAAADHLRRSMERLDRPADRRVWTFMDPHWVNAYSNARWNEIIFPAAILQPPFFDLEADDAANYGAIGAVIGHEIGHGFDDQGSKYDGSGNLANWWTDADRYEFEARTRRLVDQFDGLEPAGAPGHGVSGALTLGENIGDLGGLAVAHTAYRLSLGGAEAPVLDGLSGDQRFFIAWAQIWRSKARTAEEIRLLAVDPHSPPQFRTNVIVRNLDAFYSAFEVGPADALWLDPAERVSIW
ncbi:M13 family metallopeptidase [Kribbella sp. NPDC051587]|uniref:M13 family metallopeptidase n=1 Tax=Kribbella sp. NPDC051587 TaxID=3364119 RepID=UPI0037ACE5D2